MNIQRFKEILTEEVSSVIREASITKRFSKAVEALQSIQLKQQQLRKRFVGEKDAKKKEALKQSLITLHKQVQSAESDFNQAVTSEPIDLDETQAISHNEGILQESSVDEFTKEMNGEGITAKVHNATGDGKSVQAQFTDKKWPDGVPVTKYLTRGGYKSIKTPNGKFKVIETKKFWYYEIKNGWAAVSTKQYSTPPFEY